MIGQKLAHYEITSELGKGGMGEVWRARDTKLGRDVAIKTLPADFGDDEQRLARFQREARLLASLNHPNIAAIYGLEEDESPQPVRSASRSDVVEREAVGVEPRGADRCTCFLVLELVEGETLAERLKRGPIPVEEALALARQITEALEAAHASGVVHRDLKPANIKLTPDGKIKILDFGLAKALTDVAETDPTSSPTLSMRATRQGVILGTAAYMSPEQARGDAVDKRADIWAFGCVLFEMLSGRTVFEGRSVSDVLAGVLRAEPDWNLLPRNLHPRLREVLERCLEKDAGNRWHDIADVRVDLDKLLEAPGQLEPPATADRSRPILLWVLGTFALTTVVVATLVWNLKPSEPKRVTRFLHELPDGQRVHSRLAIARDGRRVAYVAQDQLYLRNLDETVERPVPGADAEPRAPFFSPDGAWIGYWAGGRLKKIAVGGGVPVPICDVENSQWLSVVWGEDDTLLYAHEGAVMQVSANGGTPEIIIAADGMDIREPRLLPNGETLLFSVRAKEQDFHIAVQSLATGERKRLTEGANARYVSTGHLVYSIEDALFAVAFDVDSLELNGGPVALVDGVGYGDYVISDTGTLAYVSSQFVGTQRVLALADRDGEVEVLDVPPAPYLNPRFSPDGKRLVVQTIEGATGGILWTYELSGDRAIQQLTFQGDNRRPLWTPDGRRITFASDRDGTMSLYWQAADGSGAAERLTTADEATSHWPSSWSPDGQILAFMVQKGGFFEDWDTWMLPVATMEPESLYDDPDAAHVSPLFSPDGRWLAYGFGETVASQNIYVEPFPPTGARRRISPNGGFWPMWSRDGAELFYRPGVGPAQTTGVTLRVVDIQTEPSFTFSNERTLPLEGFVAAAGYRDYDITPDGEKLLTVFPEGATEASGRPAERIHIVLNWLEELKARVPTKH